jgi:hypothetical protein
MSPDTLKLLAVLAGFAMIVAATVLAIRQTMQWQHVVVFAFGGVLAGISGIQFQANGDSVSVNIGQLASATQQASAAASQQADAIVALNSRVDQLQKAIQALHPASGPPPTQADIVHLLEPSNKAALDVSRLATQSRVLSNNAAITSKKVFMLTHP